MDKWITLKAVLEYDLQIFREEMGLPHEGMFIADAIGVIQTYLDLMEELEREDAGSTEIPD